MYTQKKYSLITADVCLRACVHESLFYFHEVPERSSRLARTRGDGERSSP